MAGLLNLKEGKMLALAGEIEVALGIRKEHSPAVVAALGDIVRARADDDTGISGHHR